MTIRKVEVSATFTGRHCNSKSGQCDNFAEVVNDFVCWHFKEGLICLQEPRTKYDVERCKRCIDIFGLGVNEMNKTEE